MSVTVAGPSLQGVRDAVTDQAGFFRALDLPIGTYTAEFRHIGYRPVVYEEVQIVLGKVTTLGEIQLDLEAVELPPIRVTAGVPAIDPVSTAIGSGLDASNFEALPIGRRDYESIINILPHSNESFFGDGVTVGGSTGLENAYFIDGANVTDPVRGTRGTRLPWNFVQSVRIRNGGYQAEYGKALGGIVDAVTYSGSNEFEINAFGFFSGDEFSSTPRTGLNDLRADAFHSFDVGLRLAGPFVRDRLWYTAAYNPRVQSIDREIPGHGVSTDRQTIHAFAAKISWHPSSQTDLDLSVFGDPSTHDAVGQVAIFFPAPTKLENPDPFLSFRQEGGTTASLRFRHQVGQRLILRADLARVWSRNSLRPVDGSDAVVPLFIDFTQGGVWSGGSGTGEDLSARRTATEVSATGLLGPHTVKLGLAYEDNRVDWNSTTTGTIKSLDLREDMPADTVYQSLFFGQSALHYNRIPAVYIQDSWQIAPRLALNAGIRWSRQHLAGEDGGATLSNEWQPRVGAVYQLGRLGTQRLFASYGRYYQQLPVSVSALFFDTGPNVTAWFSEDPRSGATPDSSLDLSADPADLPKIDGAQTDHFDEITGGYERLLGDDYVLVTRVVYRVLRSVLGFGLDNMFFFGNPGKGDLDFLPEPSRTYTALEITLRRAGAHRLQGFVSYVLSRTHGNYTGLFSSDQGFANPGGNASLRWPEQATNSTGLLPNDRTHVFKLSGSYRLPFGLTMGTFATVQSGTPLNEFGTALSCAPLCQVFLVPRGSSGRSSTLWDLNLSFVYDLRFSSRSGGRIFLDLLHIGNPRDPTWIEQQRFLGEDEDGNPVLPNPNFGLPLTFQPPMSARLGLQLDFGPRGPRS